MLLHNTVLFYHPLIHFLLFSRADVRGESGDLEVQERAPHGLSRGHERPLRQVLARRCVDIVCVFVYDWSVQIYLVKCLRTWVSSFFLSNYLSVMFIFLDLSSTYLLCVNQ